MKQCLSRDSLDQECGAFISQPQALYCRAHAGNNPRLSKKFEDALIKYATVRGMAGGTDAEWP